MDNRTLLHKMEFTHLSRGYRTLNTRNINFTVGGTEYIHSVVQPSPLSSARTSPHLHAFHPDFSAHLFFLAFAYSSSVKTSIIYNFSQILAAVLALNPWTCAVL